jgi:hypothetical protein
MVTELAIKLENHALEGKLHEVAILVEAFSCLAKRIQAGASAIPTALDTTISST